MWAPSPHWLLGPQDPYLNPPEPPLQSPVRKRGVRYREPTLPPEANHHRQDQHRHNAIRKARARQSPKGAIFLSPAAQALDAEPTPICQAVGCYPLSVMRHDESPQMRFDFAEPQRSFAFVRPWSLGELRERERFFEQLRLRAGKLRRELMNQADGRPTGGARCLDTSWTARTGASDPGIDIRR